MRGALRLLIPVLGLACLSAAPVEQRLRCGEYVFRGRLKSGVDVSKLALQIQTAANGQRQPLSMSGLSPDEIAKFSNQYVEVRARVDEEAPLSKARARVTRVSGASTRAKALERAIHLVRKVSCLPPRPQPKPKNSSSSRR